MRKNKIEKKIILKSTNTHWTKSATTKMKECERTKGGRIKGGRQGWLVWGRVVGGKWKQLYLNNNFFKGEK